MSSNQEALDLLSKSPFEHGIMKRAPKRRAFRHRQSIIENTCRAIAVSVV